MKSPGSWRVLLASFLAVFATLNGASAADDTAWPAITSQTRPWAFWWWMGSAVDKTNLTKELTRYQAAGLGGVHIIPIYGARGYESKYINYLTPEWMEMMGWSVSEANRLGMGVDMTTGTGWCFGGPQISDEDANASVVMKTYKLATGEQLTQKFDTKATQALVAYGPDGKVMELTGNIGADGTVNFAATNGTWTVYAISQKPSGQKVKRPAPGGEGWMANLIYPQSVDDFLKPYTAAFADYKGPKPRAQFQDSYEYRSDWSPVFFAEFEKRRGYRLQDELPALFSVRQDDEHVARVLCDYRQTVSEIMAEEALPEWVKWSHKHGFITRDQAHGSPGNLLDLYADADIPETEMFHLDRNKLVSKFASSAAHVMGKPLVSSETGTWLEEHFTEKLSDIKYLFDDMFLSGINHMFYHGLCYSPDEAGWPGWHFYASTEMNPRNSIWHDADAVNMYAARCQSILQSGKADNDVLVYWPIEDYWMQPGDKMLPTQVIAAKDWFTAQPISKTAKELWNAGCAFDYVSDGQLKMAKASGGEIKLPGGKYQVIVVPPCKYIPLATFKQLLALAHGGARVFFEDSLPADVSGLKDLQGNREQLKTLVSKLIFLEGDTSGVRLEMADYGKGHIQYGPLTYLGMSGSVQGEQMTQDGLSFVRRSFEGGWHYFIANQTTNRFDGWITLGREAKSVVILDPMTGDAGVAAIQTGNDKPTQVHLQLEAGGSVILRAFEKEEAQGVPWTYWRGTSPGDEIKGTWNVSFISGGPVLPADYQTDKLASWTTFPDTNAQAFAGTAKYEITFDGNAGGQPCRINLGDVRQSAHVMVNGKDYGKLIIPPYSVVVDNLKPTGNTLEVEVTGVTANRIRDLDRRGVKWKIFRDINVVDVNYKPFNAANWELTDCGLLGPVTLGPVTLGPVTKEMPAAD